MKVVVLCAGEGTRLKPATDKVPKSLLLIGDKPILSYIFDSLPDKVDEVFLIIQEKNQILFDKFLKEKNFKIKVSVLFQDNKRKGTYFALITAREHLLKENTFLVLNGDDIFLKEDLENLLESSVPAYGLGLKKMDARYRTCDLDLKNKKIVSFRRQRKEEIEKEMPCFSGALVLTKDFFNYEIFYTEGEAGIPHTLFGSGSTVYFFMLKEWLQINTLKDLDFVKEKLID